jgi:prolyl oligopeptidase
MKRSFTCLFIVFLLFSCRNITNLYEIPMVNYPSTNKVDISDNYFGTVVSDPYRWLENDTASDVGQWVKEQNSATSGFLEKIPFRAQIKSRLEEIYNYTRITSPVKVGDYYLYYKNDGLQNQSVIYVKKGADGKEEVFIDPNKLSDNGTVAVNLSGFSKNRQYIGYTISASGSDWGEIHLKEVATGKDLPDVIKYVKFSGTSWWGDGFFYSRFPQPGKEEELTGLNKFQSVYYHKLGDSQEKDILIFEDRQHPLRYHNVYLTEDEKNLFLIVAEGTDGYEMHYKPVDIKKGGFIPLFTGFENKSTVIDFENGLFYVQTDIDAPNCRLVAVDPGKPEKANWKVIIPESKDLLEAVSPIGGKLFAAYIKDVSSRLYQYDYSGKLEEEIGFPVPGTVGLLYGMKEEPEFGYSFTSFTYPTTIYRYNVKTAKQEIFFQPTLKFDPSFFDAKQVFYSSKDGARIPMFIIFKKGLELNGNNPALLYGYGGFNSGITPNFSVSIIPLLENGAVYAIANLRGGNEYGEIWHKAGMLLNKQNVFDDFVAAGEYLINEKYCSSAKLGIMGGSNGGLLVGACMTQRPDLFKVAIPEVGVMDMLRYQKFTVGFGWVPEYGSSDDSVNFKNLFKYSPLHNLKSGVEYPATLVLTSDHDDRVVPAHSFKFAATLQEKQTGKNPVLIRIESQAGHGAGKPISKVIEATSDKWAFFLFNTQSPVKY